jgi:hypothetical protein
MNSVSLHGAVIDESDDEALSRLVARLSTLCVAFGAPLHDRHTVYRSSNSGSSQHGSAASSAAGTAGTAGASAATTVGTSAGATGAPSVARHNASELRVREELLADDDDSRVGRSALCLMGQRQTGAAVARATVCGVSEVRVSSDVHRFVSQIGCRFEYAYRRVGVQGVAYAGQFKVVVSLFRLVSASGELLPSDGDSRHASGSDVWLLELETQAPVRFVSNAIDALYHWAARLYPIVEVGTIERDFLAKAMAGRASTSLLL